VLVSPQIRLRARPQSGRRHLETPGCDVDCGSIGVRTGGRSPGPRIVRLTAVGGPLKAARSVRLSRSSELKRVPVTLGPFSPARTIFTGLPPTRFHSSPSRAPGAPFTGHYCLPSTSPEEAWPITRPARLSVGILRSSRQEVGGAAGHSRTRPSQASSHQPISSHWARTRRRATPCTSCCRSAYQASDQRQPICRRRRRGVRRHSRCSGRGQSHEPGSRSAGRRGSGAPAIRGRTPTSGGGRQDLEKRRPFPHPEINVMLYSDRIRGMGAG
jgi:hypothetical protein